MIYLLFGYIKCYQPELKVKEYELYKSFYCGLCKQLKKSYGLLSTFTLSYEFSFLALLQASLSDSCININKTQKCSVNPLKKITCCTNSDFLEYSANIAMIMLYHKIKDNISDSQISKKIKYLSALPISKIYYKKAQKELPEIASSISINMTLQQNLETTNTKSLDEICFPSANSLAIVFENLLSEKSEKRVLNRLGYFLGRWIYLIDALDDFVDDQKSGCYNVLLSNGFGKENTNQAVKFIYPSLNMTLSEIVHAYELLSVRRFKPILDNILYMGLLDVQEKIINKYNECSKDSNNCEPKSNNLNINLGDN